MAVTAQLRPVVRLMSSREPLLVLSLVNLAAGATLNFGNLSAPALALVVAALVTMCMATRAPHDYEVGALGWLFGALAVASVSLVYVNHTGAPIEAALTGLLIACVAVAMTARSSRPARIGIALCGVTLLLMTAVVWRWGWLNIDVFDSLQRASGALLAGHNPYGTTFSTPNVVAPSQVVYTTIHFQYLPGAALLAAPGRFFGDVRVMSIVAIAVLFFAVIRLARQAGDDQHVNRIAGMSVALPATVAMAHYAWVDVYSVAALACWIAFRRDHVRWAAVALAASLTVKPTILIALVPFLLWSRRARREIWIAATLALLVIVPFAVMTGVTQFYQDVIGVQASLGFRYDGLTLSAGWFAITGATLPTWFGPAAGLMLAAFVLRHAPRDLADFLLAGAILSTWAFLLAKWAFLNYYFIPIWLLALALASRSEPLAASTDDVALPWPWRVRFPRMLTRRTAHAAS
ncbi:MAG: hypothetical protein ABR498_03795 [Candidatus Dormibacteria bacterium]